MYGVVLMMALSGGADATALSPATGEHVARYGDNADKAYRCGGRRRGGCHGGGWGGCSGGGWGGCSGGGWGGCHGGGYGGCCGGRYGGYYGSMPYAGSYYTYAPSGTMYYSSGTPYYGGTMYSTGTPNYGGYGYSNFGTPMYYDNSREGERLTQPGERPLAQGEAPATLIVRLPADAKLTVDGTATRSTDSTRVLISPPLQAGKEYQYSLKAEVTRDGKKVERTRDVTVRPGQPSEVTFDLPAATTAPAPPPRD
jgi:uncharacterized protein (TIGR03000 family)